MRFLDRLKGKIKDILRIVSAQDVISNVQEAVSFNNQAVINKVMYNGSSYEIEQIFKDFRTIDNTSFWGNVPINGMRKVHVGIPKIMVNTLSNLVLSDYNGIDLKDEYIEIWEQIDKENGFDELLERALKEVLITGDGAFKISYCADISDLPIIEFYSAELIEVVNKKGRIIEIIFKEEIKHGDNVYYLNEIYGKGYIKYALFDDDGNNIDMSTLEETKNLKDIAFYKEGKLDTSMFLAVPFKVFANEREENRGKSVYSGKLPIFDSIDEIISSWLQDIRISKNQQYISENLLSRDKNGQILDINAFDRKFLKLKTTVGASADQIDVLSPDVKSDGYQTAYKQLIESAFLGIISPSSVGIDYNTSDQNAKAQKEKEKTSYYNRNNIINSLNTIIPLLVIMCLKSLALQTGKAIENNEDYEVKIKFAQFDSPSFNTVLTAIGDAFVKGIISEETAVDEIWGDTKTPEEKEKEVQLLKEKSSGGFMGAEEPSVGVGGGFGNNFGKNPEKDAEDSIKDNKNIKDDKSKNPLDNKSKDTLDDKKQKK